MIPATTYQNQAQGHSNVLGQQVLANPLYAQQSFATKIRKQPIASTIFWLLIIANFLNLNGLLLYLFDYKQVFSYPILVGTLAVSLLFKLTIVRDMGKSGMWFSSFFASYLLIGGFMAMSSSSSQLYVTGYYLFRYYSASVLFLIAIVLGARHIVVAYSSNTLIKILFWISLLLIGSVFLGHFFPQIYRFGRSNTSRAVGFYLNPNRTGAALVLVATVCFARLAAEKSFQKKLFIISAIPLAAAATFLTFSRGAILSFIILGGIQIFFSTKKNRSMIIVVGLLSAVFMVSYILVKANSKSAIVTADQNMQKARLDKLKGILQGDVTKNSEGRIYLAIQGLKKWAATPILGAGVGAQSSKISSSGAGSHNFYVTILGESGVIPFILLIIFYILFFLQSLKCSDPIIRTLCIGVLATFALTGVTTHELLQHKYQILMLGICFGGLSGTEYLKRTAARQKKLSTVRYVTNS